MAMDDTSQQVDSVDLHLPSNGTSSLPDMATDGTSEGQSQTSAPGLTADEIALYDRQIRLWGAQAQERIRSANVLLISLRALGTEIAKNLTLAGISSLTIIDDEPVTEEDLGPCYFLREEDVGKPRAEAAIPRIRELNPRVTVSSSGSLASLLQHDQNFYTPFSIVIACDHDFATLSRINTTARFAGRPFYAAAIHGPYGFIFADLVAHDYLIEREKSNIAATIGPESLTRSVLSVTTKSENDGKVKELLSKRELYCPLLLANTSPLPSTVLQSKRRLRQIPPLLPCLRALFDFQRMYGHAPSPTQPQDLANFTSLATTAARELLLPSETLQAESLRSFIQALGAEMVTTAAFVGGRLSEDVINVLGKKEQPIQNLALFDAESMVAPVLCLYSPPPEMAILANGGLDITATGSNMSIVPDMAMSMSMAAPIGSEYDGTNGVAVPTPDQSVTVSNGTDVMDVVNGQLPAMDNAA